MLRVRKSCFWVNDRHRGFLALDFTPSRIRPATRTEIIRSTPDTFLLSSLCAPLQNAFLVKLRNVFDVSASSLLFLPSLFRNFASDKRKLTSTRWHVRSFPSIPSKTLFRDTVTKHYCIFFRISLWLREFSELIFQMKNSIFLDRGTFRVFNGKLFCFFLLRLFLCLSSLHHGVRKHRV